MPRPKPRLGSDAAQSAGGTAGVATVGTAVDAGAVADFAAAWGLGPGDRVSLLIVASKTGTPGWTTGQKADSAKGRSKAISCTS